MFSQMKQQRPAECVSDLRFDAWQAGELQDTARRELQQHVAACARCNARQSALSELNARFHAQHSQPPQQTKQPEPPRSVPADRIAVAERSKPRRSRNAWLLGATVAAAAGALLAFSDLRRGGFQTRPLPSTATHGERVKGSEQIAFFLKRGDRIQRGAREQRVQPGDKLRFVYTAPRARYLAILSLDSARQASVFYPAGDLAERIEPGVDVALPSAVELDAALGEERVYALFCDSPVELGALRAELVARGSEFAAPGGCVMDEVVLSKEGGFETRPYEEGAREGTRPDPQRGNGTRPGQLGGAR